MTDKPRVAPPTKPLFIQYDGRAAVDENTDDVAVYQTASTEAEARNCKGMFPDGVWFEYEVNGEELTNERVRRDIQS